MRPSVRHLWRFHLSEQGVPRLVVARVLASAHSVWCLGNVLCALLSEARTVFMEEQTEQQSSGPPRCVKGCGFFGCVR